MTLLANLVIELKDQNVEQLPFGSLRSKRFRGAKSEERGFRRFARAKKEARAKSLHLSPCSFAPEQHRNACYAG